RSEEKVVVHHGPDPANISWSKQHLAIIPAEHLIAKVEEAGCDIDPHEGEVPLQAAAQPSAKGEHLRPVQQILLWDFRAEAGEGSKYLKAARYHHQQRDRVQPMREPYRPGMFIGSLYHFSGLGRFDFDYCFMHFVFPAVVRLSYSQN